MIERSGLSERSFSRRFKRATGMAPMEYVLSRMETSGTAPLPVQHSHALHAGSLPRHHADPFDRMLIAQAQLENLHILTADGQFEAYEVALLSP